MKSTVELEMRHLPQQLIQWHSSIGKNSHVKLYRKKIKGQYFHFLLKNLYCRWDPIIKRVRVGIQFFSLIVWLCDCCLTSGENYFSYNYEDKKFTII